MTGHWPCFQGRKPGPMLPAESCAAFPLSLLVLGRNQLCFPAVIFCIHFFRQTKKLDYRFIDRLLSQALVSGNDQAKGTLFPSSLSLVFYLVAKLLCF